MSFRFAYPWVFLALLLPATLVIRDYFYKREPFLNYSFFRFLKNQIHSKDSIWMWLGPALLYTAMTLMIMGLARPQWGHSQTESTSEGIDIMLAIDASGSMAALDFRLEGDTVNRLTVVKKVVSEFIWKQKGDRLGMVIFGENAFTQCPLTLDYDILIQFLEHIHVGIAGDGTAVGDGLALSIKRLKDLPSKSKVIILLTDGRNNVGKISPEKAASIAKTFGIKVYTIGIGTHGKVPFPQKGIFGHNIIYVDLDLDEETLKNIASQTGGRYFYATDTQKLEAIYAEIARLEKTKTEIKHYETFDELYAYFLWTALGLIVAEMFLSINFLRSLS